MKRKFFTLSIALAALLGASTVSAQSVNAHAIKSVTSVKAAKSAYDNAPVRITGKITRALGDEKYELQDRTGKIRVEIDDDLARSNQLVGRTVTITGEMDVEKKSGRRSIDADYIQIH